MRGQKGMAMNIERFQSTITNGEPPENLHPLLNALWHDAHGDWKRAHEIVQGEKGSDAAAVHAYLHRKEGDLANADYWYGRAQRVRPDAALTVEWRGLVELFLNRDST